MRMLLRTLCLLAAFSLMATVASAQVYPNPYSNTRWTFPEGGGNYGFNTWPGVFSNMDTYYAISNPNNAWVLVWARFTQLGGPYVTTTTFWIPPQTRHTLSLAGAVGGTIGSFASVFISQSPGLEIYPSVSAYFAGWDDQTGYGGYATTRWEGSFGEVGSPQDRTTWYFAEGGTLNHGTGAQGFENFYKLYNPNDWAINITFNLYNQPQGACTYSMSVPAHSVYQLWVNATLAGWPCYYTTGDLSAIVTSDYPFVASLTMFQRQSQYPLGVSGTLSLGSGQTSQNWYFGEANHGQDPSGSLCGASGTYGSWQPRYYIFNPNSTAANVELVFYRPNGATYTPTPFVVAPYTRVSVDAQHFLGPSDPPLACGEFSLRITSTNGVPIVANKVQYWGREYHWVEGVNSTGSPSAAYEWHVPPGSTLYAYGHSPGNPLFYNGYTFDHWFEHYLNIFSPGAVGSTVAITYYRSNGTTKTVNHWVPANGRATIRVATDLGPPSTDFSAKVSVTWGNPVVVESTSFYNFQSPGDRMWRVADGGPAIPR